MYFDDTTVRHYTGPLLGEDSYHPFGGTMAALSSKAMGKPATRYKYNAGTELNDDLELNYYETSFRNYDAQIGRFTGVDLLAEENYATTPYNYGLNNPALYNDPTGLQETYSWGQLLNGLSNNTLAQGHYQNNGGGYSFDYTPWNDDQAFGWAVGWMDTYDHWGTQPGWASSFGHALSNYTAARGSMASGSAMGYNYITHTFSAALYTGGYLGEAVTHNGTIAETYYYAGYGDVLDFNAMAAGYALHQESAISKLQTGLDFVGLVPVLGEWADGLNAGLYAYRGDYINAGISAAAMVPLVGWAATGGKLTKRFVTGFQKHHVIPNAVFTKFETELNAIGWAQNHGLNLKTLPTPFHGNHPAYSTRVTNAINELRDAGGLTLKNMQNLQHELRQEINTIYLGGNYERLNHFYK